VLLVSHDRELLANCAERIVTVEDGSVWVHGGGFATYAQARRDRIERLDELRRRWDEEHEKLKQLVRMYRLKASYNDAMASRLQAAETRLRKFEEAGPPELPPRDQNVRMRLRGGRTGKRAVICENLELTGLMRPFSVEVWYGERVAVLGSNGSGKSFFLRPARWRRGVARRNGPAGRPGRARAVRADPRAPRPGRPLARRDPHDRARDAAQRGRWRRSPGTNCSIARARCSTPCPGDSRRGCRSCFWSWPARRCCCSTSQPTTSIWPARKALQTGLASFQGTVLAVTHDRWFAKSFDRFLVFGGDGNVYEADGPVWDETRVARPR